MIVPMKKVSLFVMDKDKQDALSKVRDLGILHLEAKTVSSPELTRLLDRKAQIDQALAVLQGFAPAKGKDRRGSDMPIVYSGDLVAHTLDLANKRKTLQDEVFNSVREKSRFEKWGRFEPKDVAYCAQHNVPLYLYEMPLRDYRALNDARVMRVSQDKKNNTVCIVSFDKIEGFYPYPLPEKSIAEMERLCDEKMARVHGIESELRGLWTQMKLVEEEKKALDADIEFEGAKAGMDPVPLSGDEIAASGISMFGGYVPAGDMGLLKRAANENGWALYADDPACDDDHVPTKLKNNRFVSLLYPLTNFLDMHPGYREMDVSLWFLMFFVVFFGMIFGDAGYGIILFLIAGTGILKTAKKGVPVPLKGLLLLSVSNILWGVFTCTWFGLGYAVLPQFLKNISLAWLSTAKGTPQEIIDQHLMTFCFTLGLTQLCIAHISSFFRKIKTLNCIAELGQLAMLIGMYQVVLHLVVIKPSGFEFVPTWALYSLLGGFSAVFVFANYEGNIFKSILKSLANIISTILGITGVFSDIMSYIRLWAVGLAGASIAATVNDMAGPLLGHFAFFVFGILLFAFGHAFNMMMNVLSVLVHGVRLNTLEFSSNIGLAWTGFAYKPFAKR